MRARPVPTDPSGHSRAHVPLEPSSQGPLSWASLRRHLPLHLPTASLCTRSGVLVPPREAHAGPGPQPPLQGVLFTPRQASPRWEPWGTPFPSGVAASLSLVLRSYQLPASDLRPHPGSPTSVPGPGAPATAGSSTLCYLQRGRGRHQRAVLGCHSSDAIFTRSLARNLTVLSDSHSGHLCSFLSEAIGSFSSCPKRRWTATPSPGTRRVTLPPTAAPRCSDPLLPRLPVACSGGLDPDSPHPPPRCDHMVPSGARDWDFFVVSYVHGIGNGS